jgi:hypothetical protein
MSAKVVRILRNEVEGRHGQSERRAAARFVADALDGNEVTAEAAAALAESLADACLTLARRLRGRKQPDSESLDARRQVAADEAFEGYDMDEEVVAAANGWEHNNQSDGWRRVFFLEQDGGPSVKTTFFVRFRPGTAEVEEAYLG